MVSEVLVFTGLLVQSRLYQILNYTFKSLTRLQKNLSITLLISPALSKPDRMRLVTPQYIYLFIEFYS